MKNFVLLALCIPILVHGQIGPLPEYDETPVLAPSKGAAALVRPTTPPYRLDGAGFSIRQVNVDDNGQNILGDAANEPSIAIDPTNPKRMAIGWRQFDTIDNSFRQAGNAFSLDEGETWLYRTPIEAGIFRSDPVLETDSEGNFYYNSLSSSAGNYYCHVFKSAVGSTEWDTGTFAHGGDKQWMTIDQTNGPTNGNIYAFWKAGISSCAPGAFTRSLDGGMSYLPCNALVGNPTRGTLVVGNEGEVYACGGSGNGFVVAKSSNAANPDQSVAWDYSKNVNMGGPIALYAGPNPSGLLGQVWIDVDRSSGATHNNLYMLATVINTVTGDPADVTFARSTDNGLTWSEPLRINDDPSNDNWQWFGSLSVAPNGRIDVTWYDTREFPGEYISRLYYSFSLDGGLTWSDDEPLGDAFDPHLGFPSQAKIGDYNHQRSDNEGVHLAWAATFNGEEDVFYSFIRPDMALSANTPANEIGRLVTCFPNPFHDRTAFRFVLDRPASVRLEILDARGILVASVPGKQYLAGENTLDWLPPTNFASGMFFYHLLADDELIGVGRMVKW